MVTVPKSDKYIFVVNNISGDISIVLLVVALFLHLVHSFIYGISLIIAFVVHIKLRVTIPTLKWVYIANMITI